MEPVYLILSSTSRQFPVQLDWYKIAADIKAAGMSYNSQAIELNKVWSSYQSMLENGPRYNDGAALLNLHIQMCGLEMTLTRMKST